MTTRGLQTELKSGEEGMLGKRSRRGESSQLTVGALDYSPPLVAPGGKSNVLPERYECQIKDEESPLWNMRLNDLPTTILLASQGGG